MKKMFLTMMVVMGFLTVPTMSVAVDAISMDKFFKDPGGMFEGKTITFKDLSSDRSEWFLLINSYSRNFFSRGRMMIFYVPSNVYYWGEEIKWVSYIETFGARGWTVVLKNGKKKPIRIISIE